MPGQAKAEPSLMALPSLKILKAKAIKSRVKAMTFRPSRAGTSLLPSKVKVDLSIITEEVCENEHAQTEKGVLWPNLVALIAHQPFSLANLIKDMGSELPI